MDDYQYLFKIVLVGESSVGKTSLVTRYADNCFLEASGATIGVDFRIRTITVNGVPVKLQIWDTAGQERFRAISKQYYRHADALIVVYDVTSAASFDSVPYWIRDVEAAAKPNVLKFLIGNKADCNADRKVDYAQGEELARANNMTFLETSAKTGDGVDRIFVDSATQLTHRALLEARVYAENSDFVYVGRQRKKLISPQENSSIFSCCSVS